MFEFEIVSSNGSVRVEVSTVTQGMRWLVQKASEYNDAYVTWFKADAAEPEVIIVMSIAGIYYKLRGTDEMYKVEIDGVRSCLKADSLAALCNLVRGKGKRVKVWSPANLEMIDTAFGDAYNLIQS